MCFGRIEPLTIALYNTVAREVQTRLYFRTHLGASLLPQPSGNGLLHHQKSATAAVVGARLPKYLMQHR